MLGETNLPELNYHEDTKLLIAVGEMSKLAVIDAALQELGEGLGHYGKHPPGVTVVPPPVGSSPKP